MINFLLVLHFFITLAMVVAILMQKNESDMGLGGGAKIGSRGTGNFLTKVTTFLAALFFANCLLVGVLASKEFKTKTIFDEKNYEKKQFEDFFASKHVSKDEGKGKESKVEQPRAANKEELEGGQHLDNLSNSLGGDLSKIGGKISSQVASKTPSGVGKQVSETLDKTVEEKNV